MVRAQFVLVVVEADNRHHPSRLKSDNRALQYYISESHWPGWQQSEN
jgi:hypothetical protein